MLDSLQAACKNDSRVNMLRIKAAFRGPKGPFQPWLFHPSFRTTAGIVSVATLERLPPLAPLNCCAQREALSWIT